MDTKQTWKKPELKTVKMSESTGQYFTANATDGFGANTQS
jgi:hypothetical protein